MPNDSQDKLKKAIKLSEGVVSFLAGLYGILIEFDCFVDSDEALSLEFKNLIARHDQLQNEIIRASSVLSNQSNSFVSQCPEPEYVIKFLKEGDRDSANDFLDKIDPIAKNTFLCHIAEKLKGMRTNEAMFLVEASILILSAMFVHMLVLQKVDWVIRHFFLDNFQTDNVLPVFLYESPAAVQTPKAKAPPPAKRAKTVARAKRTRKTAVDVPESKRAKEADKAPMSFEQIREYLERIQVPARIA